MRHGGEPVDTSATIPIFAPCRGIARFFASAMPGRIPESMCRWPPLRGRSEVELSRNQPQRHDFPGIGLNSQDLAAFVDQNGSKMHLRGQLQRELHETTVVDIVSPRT